MDSNQLSRPERRPAGTQFSSPNRMRGIGLIEVLVSVLVLGVGLLGIAAMQAMALRGGQGSLESSQAMMQTSAIVEAMRSNRANAAAYNMPAMTCAAPAGGTLAQNDLRQWILDLKRTMGSGLIDTTTCGQITGCPNACVITVQWNDTRAGGGATRTVVTPQPPAGGLRI